MANETWKFVQAKRRIASRMEQVSLLGIRDEKTRMKVTPPLALAPTITQEGDMQMMTVLLKSIGQPS